MHKTTDEGWDSWRLVILVLITLFCMYKTTGEVWDPLRLVILVQKSLFCMHKTNGEGWNPYGPDTLRLSTLLYVLKTTDVV